AGRPAAAVRSSALFVDPPRVLPETSRIRLGGWAVAMRQPSLPSGEGESADPGIRPDVRVLAAQAPERDPEVQPAGLRDTVTDGAAVHVPHVVVRPRGVGVREVAVVGGGI